MLNANTLTRRTLVTLFACSTIAVALGMSPDTGTETRMVRGKAVRVAKAPAAETKNESPKQDNAHWGYEGEHGPASWGSLSGCDACDEGIEQSPVDIPAGVPTHNADIEFSYAPMSLTVLNNGHTIQVNAAQECFIEVEGERYNLLQFHFHALSEHTVAGEHADMEVHFVHQSAAGEYAVIGVLLNAGEHNTAFAPVFEHIPNEGGQRIYAKGIAINTIDLMPTQRAYYRYDGSFTTPPCTEGVKWFVMEQPVELSASQVSAFTSLYDNNYRPVQPINERRFSAGSSSCECCQARELLSSFSGEGLTE